MDAAYEKKIVRMLVRRYENPGPQRNPRPFGVVVAGGLIFGLTMGVVTSLLDADVLTPLETVLSIFAVTFVFFFWLSRFTARRHAPAIAPYIDVDAARRRLQQLEDTTAAVE